MSVTRNEPWLRGIQPDVHPVTGHLLRASLQIREDSVAALSGLTTEQVWATPLGMTPAGFHAKHLAGSTQRLCTYLEGGDLTPAEVAAVAQEGRCLDSAAALTESLGCALDRYDRVVSRLLPAEFGDLRKIGRLRLPVTAVGLAIHIAEHAQRHVGQLIASVKLARLAKELAKENDA